MEYKFDAKETTKKLIDGIQKWFKENGEGCNACIGLSGGKDSLIVCKLCVEALGADRVIGVAMPDRRRGQGLNEADEIAKWLGIKFRVVNISGIIDKLTIRLEKSLNANVIGDEYESEQDFDEETSTNKYWELSKQAEQNIPPRVRMLTLYAISQSVNGRVIGTCNASENYIGYFTKYGDGASDFEPIAELTVHELYQIGDEFGIPKKWVYKVPDDGLPNSCPDDEKFMKMGFNYDKLDKYIREGTSGDAVADAAIEKMHKANLFKLKPVETIKI